MATASSSTLEHMASTSSYGMTTNSSGSNLYLGNKWFQTICWYNACSASCKANQALRTSCGGRKLKPEPFPAKLQVLGFLQKNVLCWSRFGDLWAPFRCICRVLLVSRFYVFSGRAQESIREHKRARAGPSGGGEGGWQAPKRRLRDQKHRD